MPNANIALNVTLDGMPVVVALMLLGLLAVAIWDATRFPGEPWFRWLLPVSYCVIAASAVLEIYPLLFLACVTGGAGLALTNYWRWTKRR